jgi:hypothetical protein
MSVSIYNTSHAPSIRDACLCIFVFLHFHSNVNIPTTAYDAWLINIKHYIFLCFACSHGKPMLSKVLTAKEKQKIMTKESLSKDGDTSGDLRKPLKMPLNWHHCWHRENLHVTKMMVTYQRSDKPWCYNPELSGTLQTTITSPMTSGPICIRPMWHIADYPEPDRAV